MTLGVRAGGEPWLADVGVDSGLLAPLRFGTDDPQRQGGWTFALHAAGPHEWEMRERRNGERTTRFRFGGRPGRGRAAGTAGPVAALARAGAPAP